MFRRKRLSGAPALNPDPTGGGWTPAQDLLWISAAPPRPGAWAALQAQHPSSGLWPLLLSGLSNREPDRPWLSGELSPKWRKLSAPADHDPAALLAASWASCVPEEEDDESDSDRTDRIAITAPFGAGWPGLAPPSPASFSADWPGLAPPSPASPGLAPPSPTSPSAPQASPAAVSPAERAAEVADFLLGAGWLTAPRLGLVPGARGADTPTDIGWTGPLNHEQDTAKISALLRSWEDRFGTRLIGLGFDTVYLSVAAPPTDVEHALRVAAEHFAFCPDNIWQGAGSLADYAKDLVDQPIWTFWWD
ncbi:DUF4253 domain-containing protein [Actinoplanes sp. NBC_00393]|uniref:DUF4253 domain-containing protein n=1 Tax=Actinoplanes sp. NBC_00393 TaxID=2975953 RepID=UPI002E245360